MIGTDQTTGLPAFGADEVIEQIPLGQMVFPFADLDASARMRRQPIYGDDIIPTSALITGQDINGTARAATMDTARRLYTRDAQLQSNGKTLADGTSGPIDVNVVAGGGSGGASPMVITQGVRAALYGSTHTRVLVTITNMLIYCIEMHYRWNLSDGGPFNTEVLCDFQLVDLTTSTPLILSADRMTPTNTLGIPVTDYINKVYVFPGGLNPHPAVPIDPNGQYFFEVVTTTDQVLLDVAILLGQSA